MDKDFDLKEWCLSCNTLIFPRWEEHIDRTEVVCPSCGAVLDIMWKDDDYYENK